MFSVNAQVAKMVNRVKLLLVRSILFNFLLLSFHVPAQADWKADWEKTLAAAWKEGSVRVYGPPGNGSINANETFKSVYPDIKMVYVPGGSQHLNRLGAERRAGKFLADIYVGGSGTGGIMAQRQK